jgi:hypothetical protein
VIERQIEATDREIDRLVYELYGLSEDEIAIVEEATATRKKGHSTFLRKPECPFPFLTDDTGRVAAIKQPARDPYTDTHTLMRQYPLAD